MMMMIMIIIIVIIIVIHENCGNEIKWRMILAVVNVIYAIQVFSRIWTRDLAIPVRRSNQLSYEATDVGSWSIMCSYVPVKEVNFDKCIWNKSYVHLMMMMMMIIIITSNTDKSKL